MVSGIGCFELVTLTLSTPGVLGAVYNLKGETEPDEPGSKMILDGGTPPMAIIIVLLEPGTETNGWRIVNGMTTVTEGFFVAAGTAESVTVIVPVAIVSGALNPPVPASIVSKPALVE